MSLDKNIQIESIRAAKRITNMKYIKDTIFSGKLTIESIFIEQLQMYREYFIENSKIEPLHIKYHYKPDYLVLDKYGDINLANFIMMLNNCSTRMDFTMEFVYIPSINLIYEVINKIKPNTIEYLE